MNTTIPIFFSIDDGYAPLLSCAIQSLIENSSKEYNYKIFILHDGLSKDNKEKLSKLETKPFEIIFKEMENGLESITNRVENRLRCDYFTLTIYFRLFIPEMFKEFDKGIYIDSDIIVTGDISKLYNLDLKDNIIGACTDNSIQDVPELVNYIENAVGVNRKEYINSGVLLMNLKEMREKDFSSKFLNLLNTYHFDCVAPDQDYLNAMCNGKILYIDEKWDTMPNNNRKEIENPNLIHYNLFEKPWCYDKIQYENYFWDYAKKSEYYKQIVEFKNNYSDNQKESDSNCLGTLISKANGMPNKEITFKNIAKNFGGIRI